MDADAQRRRQPPARPPPAARLAGGRGAGTFPRPAARAAPRRRCRRGPGARPGQSGRAGRGGAAAACALVSPPGLPRRPAAARRRPRRLLPLSGGRLSPRGADAPPPGRGRRGARLGPQPRPRPPLSGCQSAERGAGLADGRLLPGSRRPAPPPPPLPRPPQGPGKGRSVGKGWLSFNRRQSVSRISVRGTRAAERRVSPLL